MKTTIAKLLPQYHQESYHWALLLCSHDRELAHDVLQTAYEKALKHGQQFEGQARFKTWLFAIIKNTATDARRAHARQQMRLVAEVPDLPAPNNQQAEGQALMLTLLQQLSPMQRQTLQLCFYHGHTLEACAEVMGISIGSVRTHYARGKERLKALIEQHQLKDQFG